MQQKFGSSDGRPLERKFQCLKLGLGEHSLLGLEIEAGDMKKTKIK